MQIFTDASTAGFEHLSGAKSSSWESGVGFLTHARSCSVETIQAGTGRSEHAQDARLCKDSLFGCCWAQLRNSLIILMVASEAVEPGTES